jgi:hypothetical protein
VNGFEGSLNFSGLRCQHLRPSDGNGSYLSSAIPQTAEENRQHFGTIAVDLPPSYRGVESGKNWFRFDTLARATGRRHAPQRQ